MTKGGTTLVRDVACPFCALACDDLVVEPAGKAGVTVRENGCELSRRGFAVASTSASPAIGGKPASLDDAISAAAGLLGRSRAPLFAGLAADVAGVRAALGLAERLGAVVDDLNSDGLFRNLRMLQDSGWITTTLSEVRNRMDVMLIVGPDPSAAFPRFYERCVTPRDTLFGEIKEPRRLYRIGAPSGVGGPDKTEIACDDASLPAALTALRALINEKPVAADIGATLPLAALRDVAAALRNAKYGVVAWSAGAFEPSSSELIVQVTAELIRDLNRATRCGGLPLGGNDNLMGANQICTWQYGLPLRTSFAGGVPVHDPLINSARRRIAAGEADTVVWISAFRSEVPAGLPTNLIALAPPSAKFERPPAVLIPIGTPGIDHAGQIFRMDNLVALPVRALLHRNLPSAADVLNRIAQATAKERSAA
jgi:formylmethanofuran dehydrogenase subunit B